MIEVCWRETRFWRDEGEWYITGYYAMCYEFITEKNSVNSENPCYYIHNNVLFASLGGQN